MVERLPAANAIAAEIAKLSSAEQREATISRLCADNSDLEAQVRSILDENDRRPSEPSTDPTDPSVPTDQSEESSVLCPPDEITHRDVQFDASVEDATIAQRPEFIETKKPSSKANADQNTHSGLPAEESSAERLDAGEQPTGALSPSDGTKRLSDPTIKSKSGEFSVNPSLLNDPDATQASIEDSPKKKKKLPPPSIPQYDIIEEIGQGGMGVVYKAKHLKLKRLVALKMVRGSQIDDDSLARFHTEAESVAKIQHPNVVQIFEVGEHKGQPYLALEYVEGETLTTYAQKAKPGPQEAAEIVLVLSRAMACAHELDVVHRDLKPSNILIRTATSSASSRSGDDRSARSINITALQVSTGVAPKITDFGLAKQLDHDGDLTQTGTVLGTPNYMSPEQAQGVPAKAPADIYALGAILYFLLTLRPPFRGKTFVDTVMKVRSDQPKAPRQHDPSVPADLEAIALKCLEKEEEDRYETASDLADDLQRYLDGDPVQAASLGIVYRVRKYYLRRKKTLISTAATAVIVALGVLVGLYYYRESTVTREHARRLVESKEAEAILRDFDELLQGPYETRHTEIDGWINRVQQLLDVRPDIEQSLENVKLRGSQNEDGEWTFDDAIWSERFTIINDLQHDLQRLNADDGPLYNAERWLPQTPEPEDIRRAWDAILPEIESELGFKMAPVETLMPIGRNNKSGFWEFADVQTGHVPYLNDDGEPIVEPSMGLVFTLLPGGHVDCGYTNHELIRSNDEDYEPELDEYEYSAILSPFFVSKYEVPQAIWTRRMGFNNSFTVGTLNPIDSILWQECVDFCTDLGMELPTETQAEYFIRAGTTETFNFGKDADFNASSMDDYAWHTGNAYDGSNAIGQKTPNRFELHDTIGNIAEWCQDVYDPNFRFEANLVDPVHLTENPSIWEDLKIRRAIRGGSFQAKLSYMRSADRWREKHDMRWKGFGLRPTIRIEKAP